MNILKFSPFNSAVDASFWQALVAKKLNVLQLSDEHIPVQGYFTIGTTALNEQNQAVPLPCRFSIPAEGLEMDTKQVICFHISIASK